MPSYNGAVTEDYSRYAPPSNRSMMDKLYGQIPDTGQKFKSKLLLKSGDINIGLAGDSTMNASDEAADLYMSKLATDYPWLNIVIKHWDDTTQSITSDVVISAGIADTGGTVFQDTFTRTAAELYGTTPDIGTAWGRDGSNATGDWTIDGSKAVRTADATSGTMLANAVVQGDQTITLTGTISTTNTGVTRNFRIYFNYADSANSLYAQLGVTTTGITSLSLQKRINNVATTLVNVNNVIANNTANVAVTMTVVKNGLNLSATLNGTTVNGTITDDDNLLVSGGTQSGFSGSVVTGDSINDFKIEITNPAPAKKLTFYNMSMPGSKFDYQQTRLAAMFPVPLDLLLMNSGHNYGSADALSYEAAISSFIYDFKVLQPDSGIVILSQNPQKAPASVRTHLIRQATLKSYCRRFRYGYIPIMEAYKALGDGGESLISSDGVHPTPGATASGSALSRDTIASYFNSL
jgi:hypothetical protein